jgi:FlaA1/EpsC-like NDP-sugar epimerase
MQAAAMGRNGEIMLLDMGEPVRIRDLAEELIKLSGLQPGRDIEIVYTGVRPGEKLLEELYFDAERMTKTRHEKVFIGNLRPCDLADVSAKLEVLGRFTNSTSREEVRGALRGLVIEMREPTDERRALPRPHESEDPISVSGDALRAAPAE